MDSECSKAEVLRAIAEYGRQLGGPKEVRRLTVSDDWSDAMTLVALLLKHPDDAWYRSRLDDKKTREAVLEKALSLLKTLPGRSKVPS